MNDFLCNILSVFILDKKKRHSFRKKHSNRAYFAKIRDRVENIDMSLKLDRWRYNNTNDKTLYSPIKILVTYHKPYTLWQHPYLVPIHIGRAVRGGGILNSSGNIGVSKNETTLKWLHDNMLGDDTGDNISATNMSEFTALYWGWKNYEKLGSPDYMGLFHYRRLFDLDVVNQMTNYDLIIATHHNSKFGGVNKYISEIYRDESRDDTFIKEYFNKENAISFWNTIFVCKKEIYFEFCEYMFPLLFEVEKRWKKDNYTPHSREIDFLAEQLYGFFFWKKIYKDKISYKETDLVIPDFIDYIKTPF